MNMSDDKLPEAEEEISLVDLIYTLLEHWRVLVVLPGMLALGTWGAVSTLPSEWEARAILETGTVGTVGTVGMTKIETVPLLLERLKLRETRARAGQAFGLVRDSQDIERFIDAVSAGQVRNTDLVELKARAASRQDAEKIILAVIQVVQEDHLKAVGHIQRFFARRLEGRKREYEALKTQVEVYRGWSRTSQNIPERVYGGEGLFTAAHAAGAEIRMHQLNAEIVELEMLVSLPEARPTQIFGGVVNVPLDPVSPRRGLSVGLAALAGFFAALLFVFIHQVLRNAGKNPEAAGKLAKIRNLQVA